MASNKAEFLAVAAHLLGHTQPEPGEGEEDILDAAMSLLCYICVHRKWHYLGLLCLDWARRQPDDNDARRIFEIDPNGMIDALVFSHRINEALYFHRNGLEFGQDLVSTPDLELPIRQGRKGGTDCLVSYVWVRETLRNIREAAKAKAPRPNWTRAELVKTLTWMNRRLKDGARWSMSIAGYFCLPKIWMIDDPRRGVVYVSFSQTPDAIHCSIYVNGKSHKVIKFTGFDFVGKENVANADMQMGSRMLSGGIYHLLKDISSQEDEVEYFPYLGRLYNYLLKPLFSHSRIAKEIRGLGNRPTLVVISHGAISQLPFAALHDGKQYLAEKFNVVQDVQLQTGEGVGIDDAGRFYGFELGENLSVSGGQPLAANFNIRFLADNKPGRGLDEVEHELSFMRARFGRRCEVVDASTRWTSDTLRWLLKGGGVAIVSAHMNSPIAGASSARLISPADEGLSFADVTDQALETDLLVISTCNSTAHRDWFGVGEDTLVSVCRRKGARSVVGTLWPVPDIAARIYNEALLNALANGSNRAEAHGSAQLAVMKGGETTSREGLRDRLVVQAPNAESSELDEQFDHPLYWASFVLSGAWR